MPLLPAADKPDTPRAVCQVKTQKTLSQSEHGWGFFTVRTSGTYQRRRRRSGAPAAGLSLGGVSSAPTGASTHCRPALSSAPNYQLCRLSQGRCASFQFLRSQYQPRWMNSAVGRDGVANMVSAPILVALGIGRVSPEAAFMWMFGHARAVYHSGSMRATQKSLRKMRFGACSRSTARQNLGKLSCLSAWQPGVWVMPSDQSTWEPARLRVRKVGVLTAATALSRMAALPLR